MDDLKRIAIVVAVGGILAIVIDVVVCVFGLNTQGVTDVLNMVQG